MVTTKLILKPETRLERAVARWIRACATDYDGDLRGPLKDLFYGGCESGMVSELIYYCDTLKFYKAHKVDIHVLLRDAMSDYGFSDPAKIFGEKWDKEDPLANDSHNQNLLAWFGFEEAARNLANRAGYDE